MNRSRITRTATAAFTCAAVAAAIGIATGAAAPSSGSSNGNSKRPNFEFGTAVGPVPGPGPVVATAIAGNGKGRMAFRGPGGPPGPLGGPPVHSEMVVPNKAGDGFITITNDDGKVDSVSGTQLTITEGTQKATYKKVTLDIPSGATVVRDGKKAQLSDLQSGDQVHVSQSPGNTWVFATDSAFQQKMQEQFRQRFGDLRQRFRDLPKPPGGFSGGPPGLPLAPAPGRRY